MGSHVEVPVERILKYGMIVFGRWKGRVGAFVIQLLILAATLHVYQKSSFSFKHLVVPMLLCTSFINSIPHWIISLEGKVICRHSLPFSVLENTKMTPNTRTVSNVLPDPEKGYGERGTKRNCLQSFLGCPTNLVTIKRKLSASSYRHLKITRPSFH